MDILNTTPAIAVTPPSREVTIYTDLTDAIRYALAFDNIFGVEHMRPGDAPIVVSDYVFDHIQELITPR